MPSASSLTVLYYPTGTVHLRNLEQLRRLPGTRFRVIVEPWLAALPEAELAAVPAAERVLAADETLPAAAWNDVGLLFLCMAAPNRFRLGLLRAALARGVPALAVEEVNQLALNDGRINHYTLPLTALGAASADERERFLQLGWAADRVHVTGWPFFRSAPGAGRPPAPGAARRCLLVLGSLKERDMVSLETRAVRRQILALACAGLPAGWQLQIKPHPIETAAALNEIRALAPQAQLLDARAAIEPLLEQADLVVNRGNSQTVLLAMRLNKPLAVVPAGLTTIFHGALEDVLADSPAALQAIAARAAAGSVPDYRPLLERHWPFDEAESLRRVGALFAAARERGADAGAAAQLQLALSAAVSRLFTEADAILAGLAGDADARRLRALIAGSVDRGAFAELAARLPGEMSRRHLQALLARALRRRAGDPGDLIDLLDGFDGALNGHHFIDDLVARVELEYRAGRPAAATALLERLTPDFGAFPFYRQAFAMLRFAYGRGAAAARRRQWLWLIGHPLAPWTRRVVGRSLRKM